MTHLRPIFAPRSRSWGSLARWLGTLGVVLLAFAALSPLQAGQVQSYPRFRAIKDDGSAAAGYKLRSYVCGTTTPQATYADSALATANDNPTILDGSGEATIYIDKSLCYKFRLDTDLDVVVWTVDNVNLTDIGSFTTLTASGASSLQAITATTLSASGVITSTVVTGTAPFTVASTTKVANLNADQLDGGDWAAPGAAIGSGTRVPGSSQVTNLDISGTLGVTGAVTENATGTMLTANGAQLVRGQSSELLTLAAAATTDTTANLLPAGAIIEAVVVRTVTTVPTAVTYTVGDATQASRFATGVSTVSGSTAVGILQWNPAVASDDLGPRQVAAAKIRITPNLTPGAATGQVRITVFYLQAIAPTS